MKKSKWKVAYDFCLDLFKNFSEDNITGYSAQCSYYTILSFIPFLILLITLIQFTKIDPQALYDFMAKIVPESMNEFVLGIVQEVYSKSFGTISLSVIFIIWSSGNSWYALTKGLYKVYNIKDKKSNSPLYLRIKAIAQTVLLIILVLIGMGFLLFGKTIKSLMGDKVNTNNNIFSVIFTQAFILIGTFAVFLLIYKYMPKHKVSFKSQIPGAITGAIIVNIVSMIFSNYLDIFKGFSIIYGSLTALVLVMMWTYFCFFAIFVGAEVNKKIN